MSQLKLTLLQTVTFFRNVSDFLINEKEEIVFNINNMHWVSEDDLISNIQAEEYSNSSTAFWLCLLIRLMRIVSDVRLEVRHSEYIWS